MCGDGWRDRVGARTDACDGNNAGTPGEIATCDDDCSAPECGDGNVNFAFDDPGDPAGVEQCDDGNTSDSDFCLNDCQIARCGDGEVWEIPGPTPDPEACDDGNTSNTDDCRNDCQPNVCGDGIRQATGSSTEECDDGSVADGGNGCSTSCTRNDECGNRRVESLFEECDDGDDNDTGNGCSATCQQNSDCGDGTVQSLFEECDLGDDDNGGPSACCTTECTFAPGHSSCP